MAVCIKNQKPLSAQLIVSNSPKMDQLCYIEKFINIWSSAPHRQFCLPMYMNLEMGKTNSTIRKIYMLKCRERFLDWCFCEKKRVLKMRKNCFFMKYNSTTQQIQSTTHSIFFLCIQGINKWLCLSQRKVELSLWRISCFVVHFPFFGERVGH